MCCLVLHLWPGDLCFWLGHVGWQETDLVASLFLTTFGLQDEIPMRWRYVFCGWSQNRNCLDRGQNNRLRVESAHEHISSMVPWRVSSRCRVSFVLPQFGSRLTICRTLRPADVSENKKKVVQSQNKDLIMTIFWDWTVAYKSMVVDAFLQHCSTSLNFSHWAHKCASPS